jgi:hypothetical protein
MTPAPSANINPRMAIGFQELCWPFIKTMQRQSKLATYFGVGRDRVIGSPTDSSPFLALFVSFVAGLMKRECPESEALNKTAQN